MQLLVPIHQELQSVAAGINLVSCVYLTNYVQELGLCFALRSPLLLEFLYVVHHFYDIGDRLELYR